MHCYPRVMAHPRQARAHLSPCLLGEGAPGITGPCCGEEATLSDPVLMCKGRRAGGTSVVRVQVNA